VYGIVFGRSFSFSFGMLIDSCSLEVVGIINCDIEIRRNHDSAHDVIVFCAASPLFLFVLMDFILY
jgi:hypothetical protein